MMMYDKYVSDAEATLEKLREQSMINLYPEEEKIKENVLEDIYSKEIYRRRLNENYNHFTKTVKEDIFTEAYYQFILQPVLEEQMAKTRSYKLGWNLINDFIKENDCESLLSQFKHENIYLYELANTIENTYKTVINEANNRIKEGLSEDEIFNIEHKSIKSLISDFGNKAPFNIIKGVENRVGKGVSDFVIHQKDSLAKIQSMYNKTKDKIDAYNMGKQATMDNFMNPDLDQDMMNDNMLNPKLDNQQDQETINQMQDAPQMEAYQDIKKLEGQILEENYNIYEAMVRVLTEASYKSEKIKSMYKNFNTLQEDAKTMYTFLECLNITNIVSVDDKYLRNMLENMNNDITNVKDTETSSNNNSGGTKNCTTSSSSNNNEPNRNNSNSTNYSAF